MLPLTKHQVIPQISKEFCLLTSSSSFSADALLRYETIPVLDCRGIIANTDQPNQFSDMHCHYTNVLIAAQTRRSRYAASGKYALP
jgi:hypothetical protein